MFPPPLSKPTESRAHEDQFVVPKQVESCFASEADLKVFLEEHDIDTEQFGKGSAKSLAFLLLELRTGTCCFQSQHGRDQGRDPPRRLLRIVEPVFARLCCRNLLLVRVSQRFPDGRERKRKMLLAEKKGPRDGGGVLATLLRGMNEELGIPLDDIHRDGVLQYRGDTYHFELEEIDSPSYPGLLSSYRTHHVQIDLLDAGIELFKKCGFPVPPANPSTDSSSLAFETKETNRLGTTLHRWQWYTVADALRDGVVKFPPMALSSSSVLPRSKHDPGAEGQNNARKLTRDDIPDVSTLTNLLLRAGIDPLLYGVQNSKPISALHREVQLGESILEFDEASRNLRRIAEPVFVQLRFGDRVLVEVEQTLADGRTRKRNIVLAEKKAPEDENVQATVLRGLREELNLPAEFPLESAVRFIPEAYCCVAENLESSSYPGLACLYVTHYCTAQVSEAGVEPFSRGGFLTDEFETVEDGKLCRWKWTDLTAARRDKVKGLPNLKEQEVGNSDKVVYEKLLSVPLDLVGLRLLLEVGGVNVSSWGEYGTVALKSLAKELQSEASHLERDVSNGFIRRVVKSLLVQVKVSPGQSTSAGEDFFECEGTSAMSLEDATDLVHYRSDLDCFEMVHVDVTSYPGLPCCHLTREIQFDKSRSQKEHQNQQQHKQNPAASTSCGQATNTNAADLPTLLTSDEGAKRNSSTWASDRTGCSFRSRQSPSVLSQAQSIRSSLRFKMVSTESSETAPKPAGQVIVCSCDILLVCRIDQANATFQCRFDIVLQWIDKAAFGMPVGIVAEDRRKSLSIPEVALQNALQTNLESQCAPEVVNSESGHVSCRVMYQAVVQMDINMRLFPFDSQRLVLVLGMRARRDRDRAFFTQSCNLDSQVRAEEWQFSSTFANSDRPDGRARVQFGVVICRAYWYYLSNVFLTLLVIATATFAGFCLDLLFDKLRFGIAVLLAQTTFRMSIEKVLPKVAYATAFDNLAMCCQMVVLANVASNVLVAFLVEKDPQLGYAVDRYLTLGLVITWIIVIAGIALSIVIRRRRDKRTLTHFSQVVVDEVCDVSQDAHAQAQEIISTHRLPELGLAATCETQVGSLQRAVAVSAHVWLLHDIDPVNASFVCKFTCKLEWFDKAAVGLLEGVELSADQFQALDAPKLDLRNKIELKEERRPIARVSCSATGRVSISCQFIAKLSLQMNLRRFPFDTQCLAMHFRLLGDGHGDRGIVLKDCKVARNMRELEEWFVQPCEAKPVAFVDGSWQATLEIGIKRRTGFYVTSVIGVLLGISSLVFTVFVIKTGPSGFVDQGKILVSLLMTLLALKLLWSGTVPKIPYSTIFDRYMLGCEALFFLGTAVCAVSRQISNVPEMVDAAYKLQTCTAACLLFVWLSFNALTVVQAQSESSRHELNPRPLPLGSNPQFEEECKQLTLLPRSNNDERGAERGAERKLSSAILVNIDVKNIHSVNAAAGTFFCDFVATTAWADSAALNLDAGTRFTEDRMRELQWPKLMVQNALSCEVALLDGCATVVSPVSGHVVCRFRYKATLKIKMELSCFPFDEQALAVILSLPDPNDAGLHLFLDAHRHTDAVRVGEWSLTGRFATSGLQDGASQVIFGIRIKRSSCDVVISLVSLCVWSCFVFAVYVQQLDQFGSRGKILMGVLVVQNVARLSVSSKLPRIANNTAFDWVALNCVGLLFSVGCITALMCFVWHVRPSVSFETLTVVDRIFGVLLFVAWSLLNLRVVLRVRRSLQKAERASFDSVPSPHQLSDAAVPASELRALRSDMVPLASDGGVAVKADTIAARITDNRSAERLSNYVSFHTSVWSLSDIDSTTCSFDAKFHVFLEWHDSAAIGLEESTPLHPESLCVPHLTLRNATKIMLEEVSEIALVETTTGRVRCRIQFHARMHVAFLLRTFPFDCQELEISIALQADDDRLLVSNLCDAAKLQKLDGWTLILASAYQRDTGCRGVVVSLLVKRNSRTVVGIIGIYLFLTTLLFSFYSVTPEAFDKRLTNVLKIVLTQTAFRFSVAQRLPKVQHVTPFDAYLISCQALSCLLTIAFTHSSILIKNGQVLGYVFDVYALIALWSLWIVWNVSFGIFSWELSRRMLQRIVARVNALKSEQILKASAEDARMSVTSTCLRLADVEDLAASTQMVSIAFRVWLVRNVDLVTGTFECKFRLFLEWLDADACGLPKGKKAKLPLPVINIANAVQCKLLDKSSAPEVVDSETGHLAAQMLFCATLKMDQDVHYFPFDCQWLGISVGIREEAGNRSFVYQYCELESQLKLDEWTVHDQPGFVNLSKMETPTLENTVICGVLIRRCSRYYVCNIMIILGLISSLTFSVYLIDVRDFWERAEIFLGIFPLIVIFKLSAQAKLPRVGYSTQFDHYTSSCQCLYICIVLVCLTGSFSTNFFTGLAKEAFVRYWADIEYYILCVISIVWVFWNVYFAVKAFRFQRLPILQAIRSNANINLQDKDLAFQTEEVSDSRLVTTAMAKELAMLASEGLRSSTISGRGL